MASFRKRGDAWRAEIAVLGVRESATFPTRQEARAWAADRETAIRAGKRGGAARRPLREALVRFEREVSPTHRGRRWEALRLRRMGRDRIAAVLMSDLRPSDFADWRDRRLREVSPPSVAREFNLLRSVLEVARREWGWLTDNPMRDVRRPAGRPPRRRRVSPEEADRITLALGWDGASPPQNASQRVAVAFLFAIETAMRAGEIVDLTWDRVGAKSVTLPRTKNGDQREVPLSSSARALLALLPHDGDRVFGINGALRDALFRRARDRAGVVGLRFHDTRAEAITRLSKKLDIMELARAVGHRDIRSLMIYYAPTASEIADRIG